MKLYLVFIVIILFVSIVYCILYNDDEHFTNFGMDCNAPPELFGQVLKKYDMKNNNDDWEYYFSCGYDCKNKIKEFENTKGKKIYMIDGCDWPGSKIHLWKLLKEEYGKDASKYMPQTYLLDDTKDIKKFKKHFTKLKQKKHNHMFILKNYEQRQEGIKISTNLDEIINSYKETGKNKFYLVQDYLYNPFLISHRKINFRYYTLIVCRNNKVEGYIHKDGFVYYTSEFYDENSMDFAKHITTGYIDRAVYDTNPLTLDDFRNHLNKISPGLSNKWDINVNKLMSHIIKAISKKVCKNDKLKNNTMFQLFGSDVAPTNNLDAFLMEINKGPDLGAKDERDKQVKLKVQEDIFKVVEEKDLNDSRFVKVF
jgi:tubulin polyglutamylase TTLL4